MIAFTACSLPELGPQPSPSPTGGSISIGLVGLQEGPLDPARAQGPALDLLAIACDSLTGLDPETSSPVPALATSWTWNEDSTNLTVELRPRARFSDGTAVTAQSVAESLSRVARPETGSPWASLVTAIQGFDAVSAGTARTLSGVRVLDQGTMEIALVRPFSDFVMVLSHPGLMPVSITDADPACAGPYRIEVMEAARSYRLERWESGTRNEAYSNDGRGLSKNIEVTGFDSAEEAYQAVRSGAIDIGPVPQQLVPEAAGEPGYVRAESAAITYLAMDVTKPPTDNANLRRALSLAIDRLTIIDAVFGDQRRPALQWLNTSEEEPPEACRLNLRRIAAPDRAREMMAGIDPASIVLPLYFDGAEVSGLVAQALQVQTKDVIGVEITPQPLDSAGMAASLRDRPQAGLWVVTHSPEMPIPALSLSPMFESGGAHNVIGYSNATLDETFQAARKTGEEHYRRAEELLCDEMPAIPLWRGVKHWFFNSRKIDFDGPTVDAFGNLVIRNAT